MRAWAVRRACGLLGFAAGCLLRAAAGFAGDDPATRPAAGADGLAPPAGILRLWASDDPERHLEGFAAWYAWRGTLEADQRSRANRFVAREAWFRVLADATLYDIENARRRLSAYKLLRRLGGQRLFPYFLWGIDDRPGPPEARRLTVFTMLDPMLTQSGYMRRFFGRYGDPTVLDHLPKDYLWEPVRARIERRWAERAPPARDWEPLRVEDFEADLSHADPARRRLAIRALTNNRRCGGLAQDHRYRALLADPVESVRRVAAEALSVRACPAARGRLKRMVEDDRESIAVRRAALYAVARCGKAPQWTAEWMIEGVPDWPEALDPAVEDCLVRMWPSDEAGRRRYAACIEAVRARIGNERARRVAVAAMEELVPYSAP